MDHPSPPIEPTHALQPHLTLSMRAELKDKSTNVANECHVTFDTLVSVVWVAVCVGWGGGVLKQKPEREIQVKGQTA